MGGCNLRTKRGREELPHVRGQRQRPRVPGCDGAGTAERCYPTSKVRGHGRKELPHIRSQGRWPRGATPHLRSGGCTGAGGPKGAIPHSRSGGVAVRKYPSSKVRSSGCGCLSSREEIPHVQGKMVGVARGHQRADTMKQYSQKTSQSSHTRTTALSNSMKLSHACGATQDGQVMVE